MNSATVTSIFIIVLACITKNIFPENVGFDCSWYCVDMLDYTIVWFIAVAIYEIIILNKQNLVIGVVCLSIYGVMVKMYTKSLLQYTIYDPSGHITIQIVASCILDLTKSDLHPLLQLIGICFIFTSNFYTTYNFHTIEESLSGLLVGLIISFPMAVAF